MDINYNNMLKFSLPNFTMYFATYNTTLIFDMHVDILILLLLLLLFLLLLIIMLHIL